jgi:hypothetical protein
LKWCWAEADILSTKLSSNAPEGRLIFKVARGPDGAESPQRAGLNLRVLRRPEVRGTPQSRCRYAQRGGLAATAGKPPKNILNADEKKISE